MNDKLKQLLDEKHERTFWRMFVQIMRGDITTEEYTTLSDIFCTTGDMESAKHKIREYVKEGE